VLEEYTKIIAEEVSKLEVEEQTEAWTNRFIFQYANDFYSVDRLMANELDDRPYDFDRQELADVQKVGTGDVQRVAKALLDPAKLTIAIFGELTDADRESLAKSFPITVVPRDEVFSGGFDVEDGLSEASIASP
jgi:predicted Zn-dependent peptidase